MSKSGAKKATGKESKSKLNADFQEEHVQQAVLLADSFAVKFRPISWEKPKVLFPLVNIPMIDYALEFLASGGVQQVFVVCCSHAAQVEEYLSSTGWMKKGPQFQVNIVVSEESYNAGDALRHLDSLNVIKSDFVLISGDVVSNINLEKVLKAHKARTDADKRNIMTVVFKKAAPNHRTRSVDDTTVVSMNKTTGQLLTYESMAENKEAAIDVGLFQDHPTVEFRHDLMDCFIDICSPTVLNLFTDNFDYGELRKDFVAGVLGSDVLGNRIFSHVVHGEYAARIQDVHSYDSVSKDILQRWTYPLVLDNNWLSDMNYKFSRINVYREYSTDSTPGVSQARTCSIGNDSAVGSGSVIGDHSVIEQSVIGRNVRIGKNVTITNSYIWDDCVIEDNVTIEKAIICNGVKVSVGARVAVGCILSFKVVVGAGCSLAPYTLATTVTASEDDLGGEDREDDAPSPAQTQHVELPYSGLGVGGVGHGYFPRDDPLHLNSLAPDHQTIREAEIKEEIEAIEADLREFDPEPVGDEPEEPSESTTDDVKSARFTRELIETLRRGHQENLPEESIQLEAAGAKLSHDATVVEYGAAAFLAFFSFMEPQPQPIQASGPGGVTTAKITKSMLTSLKAILKKWSLILSKFGRTRADQMQLIYGLENACIGEEALYGGLFHLVLQILYEDDIFEEEAILQWESEVTELQSQQTLSSSRQALFKRTQPFLSALKEASEEEDEDD